VTQEPEAQRVMPEFDTSVPNPARMWNYWLGGKDNFAADRAAAEKVAAAMPEMPMIAKATRRFVVETVYELAAGQGIRQFLDIGTGLPVADSTHQVARRATLDARVVYVDNDPVVTSHARALLASDARGTAAYLHLDLRDTDAILSGAAKTLDLDRPVAVLLTAILHFIPDSDDPWAVVTRLKDATAPGSYLVIEHAASDIGAEAVATMAGGYNERAAVRITPRSHEQVARFFDGLRLTGPGVVPAGRWWGSGHGGDNLAAYFGIGHKA
jgi:S-adenosyl methyltransferase